MSASSFIAGLSKQAKVNAPEILAALGITGVATTSYLTAKAAVKVATDENADPNATTKEKIQRYWKEYVPAAVSGVLTVGCIIGSNQASGKRTAAAITAFSVTERAFSDYKEKVVEQLGKNKEEKIRDEIVQDKVKKNPPSNQTVLVGTGHVLCCELYTHRYFRCDMETLKKAERKINETIFTERYATLSEFYDLIGLPHTSHSDYTGWEWDEMELVFSAVFSDGPDSEPCLGFDYKRIEILK